MPYSRRVKLTRIAPQTKEDFLSFRKEMLEEARQTQKRGLVLKRDHPRIQLFLAARNEPDTWRFWLKNGVIYTQQRYGREWTGPKVKLGWDGVDHYY